MNTSGSLLSNRQRDEMCVLPNIHMICSNTPNFRHKAILSYLSTANLQSSYNALKDELALLDPSYNSQRPVNGEDDQRYKGLLEKKWTSVIRLQKKVCQFPFPALNHTYS